MLALLFVGASTGGRNHAHHTLADLYCIAIHDLGEHCQHTYNEKVFPDLSLSDQDKVLTALEHGDIKLVNAPGKVFFTMLWQNTQKGFLADPMYGGNRDFVGWKLIGFPGLGYNI